MINYLTKAVESSDKKGAARLFREYLCRDGDPWDIHLSLFPVAQRVMNPPFINPHMPKMYRICREIAPFLEKDDVSALVHLELAEFAGRPKMEMPPKSDISPSSVAFSDIEAAINLQDTEKTAALLAAFQAREGISELARRLLLLGSGYIVDSLGHSVSCTAFILLEMMDRDEHDPWLVLTTLADYFCKGRFYVTPVLRATEKFDTDSAIEAHMLQAASGRGIVNLHHIITIYSLERARRFFSEKEYNHMVNAWIDFVGDKETEPVELNKQRAAKVNDYKEFSDIFFRLDAKSAAACLAGMLGTPEERRLMKYFLVKGVCDLYQGNYNPHYITGAGSALWITDKYWNKSLIADSALYQYLDYFFSNIKMSG